MPDNFEGLFCSDVSRDAGEQLFGTVKPTTTWLLLEYHGRWQPDAFPESDLPPAVKAHLLGAVGADPQTRIFVIRQNPRLTPDAIIFYVALSRETDSTLYRFPLEQYEDLLALDIAAIRAGDTAYDAQRVDEPLFLVCTHGRRDKCCARHGIPVYERMAEHGGAAVWQTSHIGGHRFAANVVCLPEGIVYGHVNPQRAPALVDDYRAGHLIPALLRGRSAYSKPAQAAEAILRWASALTARDALRLVSDHFAEDGTVRFKTVADGAVHTLHLEDAPPRRVLASCDDAEPTIYRQLRLARLD